MRMRLTIEQSLKYMKDVGYDVSQSTYSRVKRKMQIEKLQRLYHIAKIGFEDQHLERIDSCELVLKLMWQNYSQCRDPFKRVLILVKILEVQPYLSSYYDMTRAVMKQRQKWDVINTKNTCHDINDKEENREQQND